MNGLSPEAWVGSVGSVFRIFVYIGVAVFAIVAMKPPVRHLALLLLIGSMAGILSTMVVIYQHIHLLSHGVVRYGLGMVALVAAGDFLAFLHLMSWALGIILLLQMRTGGATPPQVP